jgi:hypothetical protein
MPVPFPFAIAMHEKSEWNYKTPQLLVLSTSMSTALRKTPWALREAALYKLRYRKKRKLTGTNGSNECPEQKRNCRLEAVSWCFEVSKISIGEPCACRVAEIASNDID